eukprot:Hpha_TRINITY_DN25559_c0_g1::TRINITY_DN25559_c0_g1_i1::g.17718::m.17718
MKLVLPRYLPHSCLVAEAAPCAEDSPSPTAMQLNAADEVDRLKTDSIGSDTESVPSVVSSSRSESLQLPKVHSFVINLKSAPRRARVSLAAANTLGYLSSHDS